MNPTTCIPPVGELTERGFECEVLHWTEPYSEATWILARLDTELDLDGFRKLVRSIGDGLGGHLLEAGPEDTLDLERKHRDNDRLL